MEIPAIVGGGLIVIGVGIGIGSIEGKTRNTNRKESCKINYEVCGVV